MTAAVLLLACLQPGARIGAAHAQGALPPHAWLFGEWTGGMFPTPSSISPELCQGQPVVIFTRDVVMRGTLTDVTYVQRVIETVRATPDGAEFRFRPAAPAASPLGLSGGSAQSGFGCADPDSLRVQRRGENQISFPGCKDFPEPLVRCPSR